MPKQKVQVKIKAESFIVKNIIYTTADGRLSDCTASQKDKFIPAADAGMHYLRDGGKFCVGKRIREVVFINLGKK